MWGKLPLSRCQTSPPELEADAWDVSRQMATLKNCTFIQYWYQYLPQRFAPNNVIIVRGTPKSYHKSDGRTLEESPLGGAGANRNNWVLRVELLGG